MNCGGKGKHETDDYKYVQEHGQLVYKNVTRMAPCELCHKTGTVPCMECKSNGKKACTKCYGRGFTECGTCLGKGKITKEWKLQ